MKPVKDESKILARFHDLMNRIFAAQPLPKGHKRVSRDDQLAPPPVNAFQGIDPLLIYGDDSDWIFNPKDCTPLVEWPIDVSFVRDMPPTEDSMGFLVSRYRTVAPKEMRGIVHRISPFMLRRDILAHDRGKLVTASGILSFVGGAWTDADKRVLWNDKAVPEFGAVADKNTKDAGGFAIAMALRHRYEWAVNVGWEHSPSIRIVTDPTGLKELFRLRDVPTGSDRREALMTWVSNHWRKVREDSDVETYVRKHLRGSTKFEWKGLTCEVSPSRFDMETRDRFAVERERMRELGIDKRTANV